MADGPELTNATWRKSSYSNQDGGDCVEVADGFAGVVPVRDSKYPYRGAIQAPAASWTAFVSAVRADQLDC
ncbi:DUF397 domain-containing protein [Streptomyces sp. NPDC054784]